MTTTKIDADNESGTVNKELELILSAYQRYLQLSSYLFKKGDDVIYDINEMSEECPFYKDARSIAKQLKINWKGMSHANSNRIMLALQHVIFR